jgi:hypothetical protein
MSWSLLGIEETENIKDIKRAYAVQVKALTKAGDKDAVNQLRAWVNQLTRAIMKQADGEKKGIETQLKQVIVELKQQNNNPLLNALNADRKTDPKPTIIVDDLETNQPDDQPRFLSDDLTQSPSAVYDFQQAVQEHFFLPPKTLADKQRLKDYLQQVSELLSETYTWYDTQQWTWLAHDLLREEMDGRAKLYILREIYLRLEQHLLIAAEVADDFFQEFDLPWQLGKSFPPTEATATDSINRKNNQHLYQYLHIDRSWSLPEITLLPVLLDNEHLDKLARADIDKLQQLIYGHLYLEQLRQQTTAESVASALLNNDELWKSTLLLSSHLTIKACILLLRGLAHDQEGDAKHGLKQLQEHVTNPASGKILDWCIESLNDPSGKVTFVDSDDLAFATENLPHQWNEFIDNLAYDDAQDRALAIRCDTDNMHQDYAIMLREVFFARVEQLRKDERKQNLQVKNALLAQDRQYLQTFFSSNNIDQLPTLIKPMATLAQAVYGRAELTNLYDFSTAQVCELLNVVTQLKGQDYLLMWINQFHDRLIGQSEAPALLNEKALTSLLRALLFTEQFDIYLKEYQRRRPDDTTTFAVLEQVSTHQYQAIEPKQTESLDDDTLYIILAMALSGRFIEALNLSEHLIHYTNIKSTDIESTDIESTDLRNTDIKAPIQLPPPYLARTIMDMMHSLREQIPNFSLVRYAVLKESNLKPEADEELNWWKTNHERLSQQTLELFSGISQTI